MSGIITLTTDFGRDSWYVAAMKGVILSINHDAAIIDISHSIAPQNIAEGAFVLGEASRWFPPGTIHVAVVDPGVGTDRRIVYARVGEQHYVCPDNGLLSYTCRDRRPDETLEVTNRDTFLAKVSSTFHGRDIMAPVAARLSLGLSPCELGPPVNDLKLLSWPCPERREKEVIARILCADVFGNLITNLRREDLPRDIEPAYFFVETGRHKFDGIVKTYFEAPAGTPVALFGSSGLLELAVVQGNAALELQIPVGDNVGVRW
jgi:S-adenosyl-L-methionine hydrolase (adenosine-forming)